MSDQVKEPKPAPPVEKPKKRFRGHHLRRRMRSGRARKDAAT